MARLRWLMLLACAGAFGCHAIPLNLDPTTGAHTQPPPLKLFSVDWWRPLVSSDQLALAGAPFFTMEYQPRELASPVVDPETHRVVVLTPDGRVRSLDPDGKVEWELKTLGSFTAPASFHEGLVYVGASDGN